MFEMDKFEEALQQHKDNLSKNLSEFGEGHRLNHMHREIDSNAADYEYYFNAGHQSQQAKVEELQVQLKGAEERAQLTLKYKDRYRDERDELQKRVDKALQEIKGAVRWIDEDAIDDPDFIKGGALTALRRLEQALKGEG